jgi:hypothetical protein
MALARFSACALIIQTALYYILLVVLLNQITINLGSMVNLVVFKRTWMLPHLICATAAACWAAFPHKTIHDYLHAEILSIVCMVICYIETLLGILFTMDVGLLFFQCILRIGTMDQEDWDMCYHENGTWSLGFDFLALYTFTSLTSEYALFFTFTSGLVSYMADQAEALYFKLKNMSNSSPSLLVVKGSHHFSVPRNHFDPLSPRLSIFHLFTYIIGIHLLYLPSCSFSI